MRFEAILKHLGDFKKYQITQCLILFPPCVITAMNVLAFVLTGAVPSFRCYDDSTCPLNQSLPWDSDKNTYSSCTKKDLSSIASNSSCDVIGNITSQVKCDRWVYDDSAYKTSLTADWNLVCDRRFLRAVVQSVYMFGMLVGAIVTGHLSDRYGRKKAYYISLVVQVVTGFLAAFPPNYVTFVVLRFILGGTHSGVLLTAFVIAMEFVGPMGKVVGGIAPHFWFALGYMLLALLGYFIRYWNYLQIAMTVPGLIFLSYWWLVPESARWLIQKGRHDEAVEIIRKAAAMNKVNIPEKLLQKDEMEPTEETAEKATFVDLLTYGPRLRRNALIIYYNWFVVSLVYYGLSLTTSDLPGGSDYIKLMLSGVMELISFVFLYFFMNRAGRKFCLCFSMLLSGVTCISAAFIPAHQGYDWLIQCTAFLGKAGAGASFVLVYNYSAELFPTIARNSGVGFSSMCARVGGVMTPFISLLGSYTDTWVPVMIFGVISLIAGSLALMLPETAHRPIPETLADAEAFGLTFGKLPIRNEEQYSGEVEKPEEEEKATDDICYPL